VNTSLPKGVHVVTATRPLRGIPTVAKPKEGHTHTHLHMR